jgi:hypothetical protein
MIEFNIGKLECEKQQIPGGGRLGFSVIPEFLAALLVYDKDQR